MKIYRAPGALDWFETIPRKKGCLYLVQMYDHKDWWLATWTGRAFKHGEDAVADEEIVSVVPLGIPANFKKFPE